MLLALLFLGGGQAQAAIPGVTGTSPNPAFHLVAKADTIVTSDGDSFLMWGYGMDVGGPLALMQYPGPNLSCAGPFYWRKFQG